MAWFTRKEKEPVTTVLDPTVAERLDEATQRLEEIVHALMRRLDEINTPAVPVKKAPARKKAAAKKATPRKKEAPGG